MAYYLIQASYTSEAWAALTKNPSDPKVRHRALVEALGGRMVDFWFAFGEFDVVTIVELPDNVNMAAMAVTAIAAGAGTKLMTTPLLSVDEGLAFLKKAADLPYRRPGQ